MGFRFDRLMFAAAVLVAVTLPAGRIAAMQSSRPLTKQGYPALGARPTVTVTRPGVEPRRPLRYVIPPNQTERVDVTMRMSMGTTDGTDNFAERENRTVPPVTVTIDVGVTGIESNGDIAYDLAFSGTPIKGGGRVSNSGITRSMRLDFAHSTLQADVGPIFNAVEHLAIPFPDAAVGVGARWEVRETREVWGPPIFRSTIFQKTEYQVVSIDGATVSLRVKTQQTGPSQPLNQSSMSNPAVVWRTDVRLQSMSSSGAGTVVVHLDSLVPISESESATSAVMTWMSTSQHPTMDTAQGSTVDGKVKITIAPAAIAGRARGVSGS